MTNDELTRDELTRDALGLAAAGGIVAEMVKKHRFHNHPMDWHAFMTLAQNACAEAANLALIAERELEDTAND